MFGKIEGYSHVDQDMIWLAEYYSGSLLEFDLETKKPNSFYDINKDKLQRFGLIGNGYKMWFECYRGTFNISGRIYDIAYKFDNNIYILTGQDMIQKDIITYKKAVAEANIMNKSNNGKFNNEIIAYYFGYKTKFEKDNINFNFKPILSIPINEPVYLDIHLVTDKDLNGELIILKNNKIVDKFNAPLKKNISGGIQWIIK